MSLAHSRALLTYGWRPGGWTAWLPSLGLVWTEGGGRQAPVSTRDGRGACRGRVGNARGWKA